MENLTLAQMCNRAGLDGIKDLIELTGANRSTLAGWRINKPELLRAVILGAVQIKQGNL